MRILPVNNNLVKTSFSGRYVTIRNGSDLGVLPEWHKNSSVETTLGAYHDEPKNKVYFASPMEPIGDNIKENVDKVIYDNEPSYPDVNKEVSRNYFGNERKDYKKDFEEVREYYYRREMGGFANVDEAKYQQWQAAECSRLYDKGGHLRYVKEKSEDIVKAHIEYNEANYKDLQAVNDELKNQENLRAKLEEHIENLNKMQKPYVAVKLAAESGVEKELSLRDSAKTGILGIKDKIKSNNREKDTWEVVSKVYDEVQERQNDEYTLKSASERALEERNILKATVAKYTTLKTKCEGAINMLTKKSDSIKKTIEDTNIDIKKHRAIIEDCKAKLIPIFDELKNFYAKQGIKVIKKI